MIFVFGSNLAGRHGKGAAADALNFHRAIYGQGEGLQGNSYAIPTKDYEIKTRPLELIKQSVLTFMKFADAHPELQFHVTRIGCGLAGYTDEQMAPMFLLAPDNCFFSAEWQKIHDEYWKQLAGKVDNDVNKVDNQS